MGDLITRAAALDAISTDGGCGMCARRVLDIPAVDAAPIVRCKDCKHIYYASNRTPDEQCWVCSLIGLDVIEEWFCASGEREDSE